MKSLRFVFGLVLGLALVGCETFKRDKSKAEPPAEITIRSIDILHMQRVLTATFNQQGWEVASQTDRALNLSQPMTPDDAVRYYGRYPLVSGYKMLRSSWLSSSIG